MKRIILLTFINFLSVDTDIIKKKNSPPPNHSKFSLFKRLKNKLKCNKLHKSR